MAEKFNAEGTCDKPCVLDDYYNTCNDLFVVAMEAEGKGEWQLAKEATELSLRQDGVLRRIREGRSPVVCEGVCPTDLVELLKPGEEPVSIDCPVLAQAIAADGDMRGAAYGQWFGLSNN